MVTANREGPIFHPARPLRDLFRTIQTCLGYLWTLGEQFSGYPSLEGGDSCSRWIRSFRFHLLVRRFRPKSAKYIRKNADRTANERELTRIRTVKPTVPKLSGCCC